MTDTPTPPRITRKHLARLRGIYRSSGWPCRDPLEVDLIVGGLVQSERDDQGRETLHLTPAGLQALAEAHASNRANRSAHDELVMQVAQRLQQEGRIAWTQLALRAQVDGGWTQAIPDVFSIRHTTVEAYLEPVVHEIKVSRADLLARPKKSDVVDTSKAIELTAGAIDRLTCRTDIKAQAFLRDTKAPGLRVRVTNTGAKSFVFEAKLNRQTIRRTIGDVKAWSIEQARAEARRLAVVLDSGQDPREIERQQQAQRDAQRSRDRAQAAKETTTGLDAWAEYIKEGREVGFNRSTWQSA